MPRTSLPRRAVPGNARVLETLGVVLTIVAISYPVLYVVLNPQAFLNFYHLPVAWASWRLGRRRGVAMALGSAAIVLGSAFMNESLFRDRADNALSRWLDLGIWAGFLFLTAYAIATLAERDRARMAQLKAAYRGVIEIMAKFIDSIDRSTENHSRRVAERAVELGRAFDMNEDELETLRVAAYLHDIGKVDVSADLLHKASALTPAEQAAMAQHVDHGTRMLRRVGGLLENVVPVVLYHHERWDGRGYKGLAGSAIPLAARIIAVCDTYDALVADRVYRDGRSHHEAIAILRSESGKQFDPTVVTAFLARYHDPASEPAEAEPDRQAA